MSIHQQITNSVQPGGIVEAAAGLAPNSVAATFSAPRPASAAEALDRAAAGLDARTPGEPPLLALPAPADLNELGTGPGPVPNPVTEPSHL